MKTSFIVSLLILSLLLVKVQGIRLRKVSLPVQQQQEHEEQSTLLEKSNTDADQETVLCKDNNKCTGKIKNRKLVTTSFTTTQSLSKNEKNEVYKVDPSVNGNARNNLNTLSSSKQKYVSEEHDLEEITEMDYSPAKRKPPIHN